MLHSATGLASRRMQNTPLTVAVADGSLVLPLPQGCDFGVEEDGTIWVALEEVPDLFTLRISSITAEAKSPEQTRQFDFTAETVARGRELGAEISQAGETAWYHRDEKSENEGQSLWIRFWWMGYRNSKVILSLTCDEAVWNDPRVQAVATRLPELLAVASVRGEKSPPTTQEARMLDEQRAAVREFLQSRYDVYALPELRSDLPVLQELVDDRVFHPDQEYEWSCVGVVFGDVLARELDLHWIVQTDEYGPEPALRYQETSITLFPRTMLLKRVERGEWPDLAELLEGLSDTIERGKREWR